jgi:hypothetical protein
VERWGTATPQPLFVFWRSGYFIFLAALVGIMITLRLRSGDRECEYELPRNCDSGEGEVCLRSGDGDAWIEGNFSLTIWSFCWSERSLYLSLFSCSTDVRNSVTSRVMNFDFISGWISSFSKKTPFFSSE